MNQGDLDDEFDASVFSSGNNLDKIPSFPSIKMPSLAEAWKPERTEAEQDTNRVRIGKNNFFDLIVGERASSGAPSN